MKKASTLSTVVMFLIAILIAWGCKKAQIDNGPKKDVIYNTVVIYLRVVNVEGTKFLYMYDSNGSTSLEPLNSKDTGLVTFVKPGTEVFWELDHNSGIKKIKKISPSHGPGKIIIEDPSSNLWDKTFYLKLPDNIPYGSGEILQEKYTLNLKLKGDSEIIIDPFLRVPPPPGKE